MEFDEVREYQIGDDVRSIDWNVTARTGIPHVKRFVEERELTVMLMVDASASSHFGTDTYMKGELAARICALLAFSAIKNKDRVGLIIFTDREELYVPPRKGKTHVLRLINDVYDHKSVGTGTDISKALNFLLQVQRRKAVVFLISDFPKPDTPKLSEKYPYEDALAIANKKHDVICVRLFDQREIDLPSIGLLELEDAETGEQVVVDTSDPEARRMFAIQGTDESRQREKLFRSLSIDSVDVSTGPDYVLPLMRFFEQRVRKASR